MRAVTLSLFMLTLALPGQVPAPEAQPQWLSALQKLQQEMHQAPLGSLDAQFETAWRSAIQAAVHPQFPVAAQIVASFYQMQGYELKAEQILQQAIALVPEADSLSRRTLKSHLAQHFEMTQRLTKAVTIREELAKDRNAESKAELSALAHIYERIGEIEKAETLWKEISTLSAAASAPNPFFRPGNRDATFLVTAGGYPRYGGGDLAGFYKRIGRKAEAEQAYRKVLESLSSSDAWHMTARSYMSLLSEQRRFDEAEKLAREAITRAEASDPTGLQASNGRRFLANLLLHAGRPEEALALERENVQRLQAQGPATPQYIPALQSLADALITLNRAEEAEKIAAQIRDASTLDGRNSRFYESIAAQTLARIRDLQKRPEEAARIRAGIVAPEGTPERTISMHELIVPAQEAAQRGNLDEALALADKALAFAAERVRTNPTEAANVINLVHILKAKGKENDALRVATTTLRILEQASPPDRPQVAEALGSVISSLALLGMTSEAEQAIERMEKIFLTTKGPDSLSLDAVNHGRIALLQRQSNLTGALDEMKKIQVRTEKRSGPKSRESLHALRAVAWAYPPLNKWSEEERLLMTLLERTVNLSGESSLDHAHLLEHIANRASQSRQHDQALASIDKAIEVTRTLPGADMQLPNLIRSRAQILQRTDAPAGIPPGGSLRWFDKSR